VRRTLDIGCGSYPRGDVGVDIDFSWSNPFHQPWKYDDVVAPRSEVCDRVRADVNYPLPFRDECFDAVLIVHTLEHLLRPYECLLEVRRVLRRGGKIVVVVPNARKNLADWRDEGHVFSFTEPTIRRLISKVFTVQEVKMLFEGDDIMVVGVK